MSSLSFLFFRGRREEQRAEERKGKRGEKKRERKQERTKRKRQPLLVVAISTARDAQRERRNRICMRVFFRLLQWAQEEPNAENCPSERVSCFQNINYLRANMGPTSTITRDLKAGDDTNADLTRSPKDWQSSTRSRKGAWSLFMIVFSQERAKEKNL